MDKIRELLQKYREQAAYVFFGGLTTLVNIVAYFVADSVLHMATVPATAVAQVLAVLFAYVTNKKYVFKSETHGAKELLREMGSFFACRAVSFVLDIGIMWLTVDNLGWLDAQAERNIDPKPADDKPNETSDGGDNK